MYVQSDCILCGVNGSVSGLKRNNSLWECYVASFRKVATLSEYALPQLHAHDAEDEEDEEAQQEDVSQHGQRVQEQHH